MKKFILIILLSVVLERVCLSQIESEHFTFPAEFEKHEAIWMGWRAITVEGIDRSETLLNIIKTLTPYVAVNLIIDHDSICKYLYEQFERLGIDKSKVKLFVYPNPRSNVRDPGPVFLKSKKGNLMIADMKWNSYGFGLTNSSRAKGVDSIDHYAARRLNLPIITSQMVSEGGDREFNGRGTMMAVEYTEMNRNKGWTKDSIEKELLRVFGQKKIIWLKQGAVEDDPGKSFELQSEKVYTIGVNHIDEFARFVSPTTILLAEVTKAESSKDHMHELSRERLEKNYQLLKKATDQDGKPFKIIRVPVPETITKSRVINGSDTVSIEIYDLPPGGGSIRIVLATSYLNFLVTNGIVLMASYWEPGLPNIFKQKDEKARRIIEKVFPGRKVIAIHVEPLNETGGGIHCATQQQPSSN